MKQEAQSLPKGEKVAGLRQVLRGIAKNQIASVILSKNAELNIKKQVADLCRAKDIPFQIALSKEVMGFELGLEVPCAVVGILK
jgi:ribosomal protein L7Ae-like RNA K-turn-binding protein